MRTLSAQALVSASRTSLCDIEFLFLDNHDVEKVTDALIDCERLQLLSLSRNNIGSSLVPIASCVSLWYLDLSHNRIESLEGFQNITALGYLDLSFNRLPVVELEKLRDIDFVHLQLEGNPKLQHAFGADYRRSIISRIPSPWILDCSFVDASERAGAAAGDSASGISGADAIFGAGVRHFSWRSGSWGAGARSHVGELAMRHLQVLEEQPSRPYSLDLFRLRRLATAYDGEAAWFNGFIKRTVSLGVVLKGAIMILNHRASPLPLIDTCSSRSSAARHQSGRRCTSASCRAFLVPKSSTFWWRSRRRRRTAWPTASSKKPWSCFWLLSWVPRWLLTWLPSPASGGRRCRCR